MVVYHRGRRIHIVFPMTDLVRMRHHVCRLVSTLPGLPGTGQWSQHVHGSRLSLRVCHRQRHRKLRSRQQPQRERRGQQLRCCLRRFLTISYQEFITANLSSLLYRVEQFLKERRTTTRIPDYPAPVATAQRLHPCLTASFLSFSCAITFPLTCTPPSSCRATVHMTSSVSVTATPVFAASLLLDARQVRPSSVRLEWNISPKLGLISPHYTYAFNLSLGPTRLNKPSADPDSTLCRH